LSLTPDPCGAKIALTVARSQPNVPISIRDLRSKKGERMILDENAFIEILLAKLIISTLTVDCIARAVRSDRHLFIPRE
jgi:hypothetical protein